MSYRARYGQYGMYGDGSDGDVTISADTNLARTMFYNNLTVNSGKTLNTKGFPVYVNGILNIKGTITTNAAGCYGAIGTGGKGGSTGAGQAGTSVTTSFGGAGGTGGSDAFAGGAGGTVTKPTTNQGGLSIIACNYPIMMTTVYASITAKITGGAGGGAGSSLDASSLNVAGGDGGGVVAVYARSIYGDGSISADGANGQDGGGL